jgi:hypothetical protein
MSGSGPSGVNYGNRGGWGPPNRPLINPGGTDVTPNGPGANTGTGPRINPGGTDVTPFGPGAQTGGGNIPMGQPGSPYGPLTPAPQGLAPTRPNVGPINMGHFDPRAFASALQNVGGRWGSLNPNIFRGIR